MKTVVYFSKTNLNTDGRILNQLQIIQKHLKEIQLDFILFADKPLKIEIGENIRIHEIQTGIRNSIWLRPITVFDFTLRSLFKLHKLKPTIIHAQDTAVCLPVLLYKLLINRKVDIIYDDHEMLNENASISSRFYNIFEVKLMKIATSVIFANKERMEILKNKYKLTNRCTYFLNLPYYENHEELWDQSSLAKLKEVKRLKDEGCKFIIHQGVIAIERGRSKLAAFSKLLPKNVKIMLLGGSSEDYYRFIKEFNLESEKFHFIGTVNYTVLNAFWKHGMASVVMYLPNYINNKLCAPNRLYISAKNGIPIIVNKNNPVLSNFITQYNCGIYIEDLDSPELIISTLNKPQRNIDFEFEKLRLNQIENFVSVYKNIVFKV